MPPGDHTHSPGYCDSLTLRNIRAAPSAAPTPPAQYQLIPA
jgi:hypothetical protein